MRWTNTFIDNFWEYHSGYSVENADGSGDQEGAREAMEGAISELKRRTWWWIEYSQGEQKVPG